MSVKAYKEYLKAEAKRRPLKPRGIASYASNLNRVPHLLKVKQESFFRVTSPGRLHVLFGKLVASKEFKSIPVKSQGNIKTAFRRYIDSVENLERVMVQTKVFLLELNRSFVEYRSKHLKSDPDNKLLQKNLTLLLETNLSAKPRSKAIWNYAHISSKRMVRLVHKVYTEMIAGNYQAVVATEPEATARVLSIKAHIAVIKKATRRR